MKKRKTGNKKGCSLLDAIYENWFQKQLLLQYWHTYLQKHEGPTLAAFINDPMWKEQVEEMLGSVHEGRANLVLGKEDRIETVESSHRGEGFKDAITYHDIMIFRKMNIGTLLLGQQETAGAYSQSETQFDILKIFLDGIHTDIAAELQGMINSWYEYQYPALTDVPQIHFESFEEKDITELLTVLKPFIDNMTVDPSSSWFKQIIGDLVSNYSDIDMSSYLKSDETKELKKDDTMTPSKEDINTPVEKQAMENIKEILSVN
jgi:hypothetical protein